MKPGDIFIRLEEKPPSWRVYWVDRQGREELSSVNGFDPNVPGDLERRLEMARTQAKEFWSKLEPDWPKKYPDFGVYFQTPAGQLEALHDLMPGPKRYTPEEERLNTPEEVEQYMRELHRPYKPTKWFNRPGHKTRARRAGLPKRAGVHVGDELECVKQTFGTDVDGGPQAVFEPGDVVSVIGIGSGVTVKRSGGHEAVLAYNSLKFFRHKSKAQPAAPGGPPAPALNVGDTFVVHKPAGQLAIGTELKLAAPAMGGGFWVRVNGRQFQLPRATIENMVLTQILVPKGAQTGAVENVMTAQARRTQARRKVARSVSRDEYEQEINDAAKELVDEYYNSNGEYPSDSSDLSDEVHEYVDGHNWIIYTDTERWDDIVRQASNVFGCGDPDPVGDGLLSVSSEEDCEKIPQLKAFMAMECSMFEAIREYLDNLPEEEEEEEEEEDDEAVPAGAAGPQKAKLIQNLDTYYGMGQRAPAGAPVPGNIAQDPAAAEAFRAGNYDMHGSGFGPPPKRTRKVVDIDPRGMPVIARLRRTAAPIHGELAPGSIYKSTIIPEDAKAGRVTEQEARTYPRGKRVQILAVNGDEIIIDAEPGEGAETWLRRSFFEEDTATGMHPFIYDYMLPLKYSLWRVSENARYGKLEKGMVYQVESNPTLGDSKIMMRVSSEHSDGLWAKQNKHEAVEVPVSYFNTRGEFEYLGNTMTDAPAAEAAPPEEKEEEAPGPYKELPLNTPEEIAQYHQELERPFRSPSRGRPSRRPRRPEEPTSTYAPDIRMPDSGPKGPGYGPGKLWSRLRASLDGRGAVAARWARIASRVGRRHARA